MIICMWCSVPVVCAQQMKAMIRGNMQQMDDTVTVKVWPDYAGADKNALTLYSQKLGNNGFRVIIPHLSGPARLSVISRSGSIKLEDYYICPGDDISIHNAKQQDVFRFSGKGAAHFRVKYQMDSVKLAITEKLRQDTSLRITGAPVISNLQRTLNRMNKLTSARMAILEQSRQEISTEMHTLYYNYLRGIQISSRYASLQYYYYRMDSPGRKTLIAYALQLRDTLEAVSPCPVIYMEAIVKKEQVDWLLKRGAMPEYQELYEHLKKLYTGAFREMLITGYLFRATRTAAYEASMKDALTWINSIQYRRFLQERLSRFSRGSAVYPFEWQDTSGRTIRLQDLAGKVLVMDFWFTGCSACEALAKDLIPVVRAFSGRPDVVFTSISVDQQKSRWIQSIRKGKYTHPGNLNLYTNGKGIADPFIRYYDFTGFPRQLLIDKRGRMFDIPPRPDNEKRLREFIQLVNMALRE